MNIKFFIFSFYQLINLFIHYHKKELFNEHNFILNCCQNQQQCIYCFFRLNRFRLFIKERYRKTFVKNTGSTKISSKDFKSHIYELIKDITKDFNAQLKR